MVLAILLAPTLAAREAYAEPPPARALDVSAAPKPPEPTTQHIWYGGETLLVDTGAAALLFAFASDAKSVGFYAGLAAYALGGPVVHLANAQPERAGISLALRVLLPAAGAAIGYATYRKSSDPNAEDFGPGFDAAVFGTLAGLAAAVIDAAAVAHKDVPVAKPGVSLTPRVSLGPYGSVNAGVGGTF